MERAISKYMFLIVLYCEDASSETYQLLLFFSGYANDENESCGSLTESNVDLNNPKEVSKLVSCAVNKASAFSPVFDRNLRHALNSGDYALRKIKKGEEVTTDYLEFAGDPEVLIEYTVSLRRICSGQELGDIDEYQGES